MLWIILSVLAALAAIAAAAVAMRRGLARLGDDVDLAWQELALQLDKRQQHVTAIATLCGRVMRDRPQAVERIVTSGRDLQAATARRDLAALASAEKSQHAAVAALFKLSRSYPPFAASQAFELLIHRLATLDDRVTERRERYNGAASVLNLRCGAFPNRVVAALSGFGRAELSVEA